MYILHCFTEAAVRVKKEREFPDVPYTDDQVTKFLWHGIKIAYYNLLLVFK